MGTPKNGGPELAPTVLTGSFTGTGQSDSIQISGYFNAALWGTFVGTIELQRSFDGGTTWLACSIDTAGTAADYTAPVSLTINEPEPGVIYRWDCTAYTSGTINYRISGGARLT